MRVRIPFARSTEGVMVTVNQVARGKACNCTCLICGMPLIARKGNQKIHHFAHASAEENHRCQTVGLNESPWHKQLKQSVADLKGKTIHFKDFSFRVTQSITEWTMKVENMNRRFDVLLKGDIEVDANHWGTGFYLIVEVYVTNQKTSDFAWELYGFNFPCVEIQVDPLGIMDHANEADITIEAALRKTLIHDRNERWISFWGLPQNIQARIKEHAVPLEIIYYKYSQLQWHKQRLDSDWLATVYRNSKKFSRATKKERKALIDQIWEHIDNRCRNCLAQKGQTKYDTCWDCAPRKFKCQNCNGPKQPGFRLCRKCAYQDPDYHAYENYEVNRDLYEAGAFEPSSDDWPYRYNY